MLFVVLHDLPRQSTLPTGTVLSGSNDGFGVTRLEARQVATPIKWQAYLGMNGEAK